MQLQKAQKFPVYEIEYTRRNEYCAQMEEAQRFHFHRCRLLHAVRRPHVSRLETAHEPDNRHHRNRGEGKTLRFAAFSKMFAAKYLGASINYVGQRGGRGVSQNLLN